MSVELIAGLLQATPGWDALEASAGLEADDTAMILSEAWRLGEALLEPLAAHADEVGCRIENGRLRTPDGYAEAFARLGADGWLAADLPEDVGGQGLPLAIHAATSLGFEGAAMPFMMLAGSTRAAAHCLLSAAPELAATWAPKLASGDWAATICISEPDAGSDVGRIRTRAEAQGDHWRITGQKCWISFGDHDMTTRIGHLCLARTGAPEEGTRGLSLFLIPDVLDDGRRNAIRLERIEEKLGLHGSPTCVLSFEGAEAQMLGAPGRGLSALFAMIERMRLQTGCQGAGIALRAAALARRYAGERLQGGRPDAAPVPILSHPDVRRQLLHLDAQAALLVALVLEAAVAADQARTGDEGAELRQAFLLPLAKNFGGELAFETASGAMQVLGGAGYTREWPAERYLRDARIITIYEGTTGMQAQDFLVRRLLKDEGRSLAAFLAAARAELAASPPGAAEAGAVLDRFEALAGRIAGSGAPMSDLLGQADGYLRAGFAATSALLATRMAGLGAQGSAWARYHLHFASAQMTLAETACDLPPELLEMAV
ncbi:acyl-CoA dehydrogenase family protein [Oceanicola sp. S124]|uniref:acyl-CoA dehydrogenase family protein n=1 Tax=Oceanicola sp. S124 TaxID=1042378 RepID=UPI00025585FE|nr:acyl-CoA dehydrogenase family protein [Oceanicola sp. S124]